MSRTIRRKNPSWSDVFWFYREHEYRTGLTLWLEYDDPEARKKRRKFHSDGYRWKGAAPHHWCNKFERSIRQGNRQELHRFKALPDYEPLCWCRHRRSATYDWW